ncbi:hypothetical protein SFC66_06465 [Terribacillus saccharophilus]|uniref:hypothetical protein n=1 Tax=Terribacillus saccharophilus TaxID=361277 RepID=UPI0039819AE4
MNEKLKDLILAGECEKAQEITDNLTYDELDALLTDIAFSEHSLAVYTFTQHLLLQDETIQLHEMAFELLVHPLCHLPGAYFSALYHARRCITLAEPEELKHYLTYLLFLHEVPDKVVGEQEALAAAKRILELNPNSEVAQKYRGS